MRENAALVRDFPTSGLFWSMNCESCEDPKNSFTAAATGFALIISWGMMGSLSAIVRRSLTARLDSHQSDAEGVLGHFTHAAHTAIAQMVDGRPTWAVAVAGCRFKVFMTSMMSFLAQDPRARDFLAAPRGGLKLHAAGPATDRSARR